MTRPAKYVILDTLCITPIVFSDVLAHNEIAAGRTVLGAGFCYIENDTFVCYGRSTSLRIDSNPERDAALLNKYLGLLPVD